MTFGASRAKVDTKADLFGCCISSEKENDSPEENDEFGDMLELCVNLPAPFSKR
jgi:hypothetical protein